MVKAQERETIASQSLLEPIRKVIQDSHVQEFIINQNYELLADQESLLSSKLFDSKSLIKLFHALYDRLPPFVPMDVVVEPWLFKRRLDELSFLKARHNHETLGIKKLSKSISAAQHDAPGGINTIRIDCITQTSL